MLLSIHHLCVNLLVVYLSIQICKHKKRYVSISAECTSIRLVILNMPPYIQYLNRILLLFMHGRQMEIIELLSLDTGWICALRFSFRYRLRISSLIIFLYQSSCKITNTGSPKCTLRTIFTISSSSLLIGWDTSIPHTGTFNLSHRRLSCRQR